MISPTPIDEPIAADPANIDAWHAVARRVQDVEPNLELVILERDARIYEADGTLYAVQLAEEQTLQVHAHALRVRRGDLVVIPAGLAVDVDGPVNMMAIRDAGEPPDHFRERFIQVWGVDHLPAPTPSAPRPCRADVVRLDALQYRIPYAIVRPSPEPFPVSAGDQGWHLTLVVALEGRLRWKWGEREQPLGVGDVVVAGSARLLELAGDGLAGVFSILPDALNARRRSAFQAEANRPSPEYRPMTAETRKS